MILGLLCGIAVLAIGFDLYWTHREMRDLRRDLESLNRKLHPPGPPSEGPYRGSNADTFDKINRDLDRIMGDVQTTVDEYGMIHYHRGTGNPGPE